MRHANATNDRKHEGLSMKIYSALLGDTPEIQPTDASLTPRLKMRVRVEARIERKPQSPFRPPTLRDSVERYAAYAAEAINEARERLSAARSTIAPPRMREQPKAKPVVLIGPSVRKSKVVVRSVSAAA